MKKEYCKSMSTYLLRSMSSRIITQHQARNRTWISVCTYTYSQCEFVIISFLLELISCYKAKPKPATVHTSRYTHAATHPFKNQQVPLVSGFLELRGERKEVGIGSLRGELKTVSHIFHASEQIECAKE